ncbi:MAG: DUF1573 domain-containing protein [Bacteroidetes bacterium]|nr:DUF1573 domain-containing protein [Bacteroidota bacterium]
MKKIFLGLILLCNAICLNAQKQSTPTSATAPVAATPSVVNFDKVKHSFGKIRQDVPKSISFTVKNNGSKPLIIEQATAQCGCTTPEYSKAPILKGKTSAIKVTYNAKNPGPFTKTVTVKFLGVAEPSILTIEGEVLKSATPSSKG